MANVLRTYDDIYNFLYDVINEILNIQFNRGIPIVRGDQSHYPSTKKNNPYITISAQAGGERIGWAERDYKTASGLNGADEINTKDDWQEVFTIYETDGHGDLLRLIISNLESQKIIELFYRSGYSWMNAGDVIYIPRIKNESTIRECMFELTLALRRQITEKVGYIETVTPVNNINTGG